MLTPWSGLCIWRCQPKRVFLKSPQAVDLRGAENKLKPLILLPCGVQLSYLLLLWPTFRNQVTEVPLILIYSLWSILSDFLFFLNTGM